MNTNQYSLKPGEIRLDFIPIDWPLTPLGANKDPYVLGWQNKTFSVREIEEEIITGKCKAVGLLGGPAYNHPFGLVWVDVDGPTVYDFITETTGVSFREALPDTLTIFSGKEGRERKLYKLDREKHKHFIRNKYTWHAEGNKEKLEILWKKHQGVLMGLHPETDGYYTKEGQGFEWVSKLPELPDWILTGIINKNVKQGAPPTETTRVIGPGFAINTKISLEREIQCATEATWALPIEATDDYDTWIIIGQTLHEVDESLLDVWDEWSKQSEKYKEGECHRRWKSFKKGGGRTLGTLIHLAQQNGWQESQDHKVLNVDDATLEEQAMLLSELESQTSIQSQVETVDTTYSEEEASDKRTPKHQQKGKGKDQKRQGPSCDLVASVLLRNYGGNLRYSQAHAAFFLYEYRSKGLWSQLTDHEVKGNIKAEIELIKEGIGINGYSMNLINDVMEQLRITTLFDDWYEDNDLLLFTNGVLNVETRELLPFKRDLHLTQRLPYPYDPGADCDAIVKWLKHAQDDNWDRVQVLRAWLRAVLLSHSDIQRFVEIVGPGKSGKSTYANLAHALVGDDNAMISSLEHLEKNRFETANLYKKKLLLFNDVERYGGSVSILKAITGRDLIRNERKFQAGNHKPFKFSGLVMITANEPIQTTDPTSGLARRRLTIPFNKPFKGNSSQQRTLIDMDDKGNPFGDFAPLLPGLVNWVLDMSEADMREYLMETNKKVDFFAKHHTEQILKSNQIMDWMHHCVVFDQGSSALVGLARRSPGGGTNIYMNCDKWLYASYCEFSRGSNTNILGRSRFESLLLDVCIHQLGLNVYAKKDHSGYRLFNLACRASDMKYERHRSIVEVGLKHLNAEGTLDETMEDDA